MGRLIIVSNRLPINVNKRGKKFIYQNSAGGLATGLGSIYKKYDSIWIGWPGIIVNDDKEEKEISQRLISENCFPIFISQYEVDKFYNGFCNKTIWPLFHYFQQYARYEKDLWDSYKQVNEKFCEVILNIVDKDDIIWIHDYHLMLLPELLRRKLPDITIGFFLHIPFPAYEVFRLLPWREEILYGILGADFISFHIYDYALHFLNSVYNLLGYDNKLGEIYIKDRKIKVDAFPMGIDYEKFKNASLQLKNNDEINKIYKDLQNQKVILSIDRLDYTKGIPNRLRAYSKLLEKNPDYINKVTLILVAVPSRSEVEHYKLLKKEVDELVGRINGKYGTFSWTPVKYIYRYLSFEPLVSLYRIADIALITPLRDGMNLMAKEYIATNTDGKGVLIISETAGSARDLGEAIIINPNNENEMELAIEKALTMPEQKQIRGNKIMQDRIKEYSIDKWAERFINTLINIKNTQKKLNFVQINKKIENNIIVKYNNSNNRLLLLDYDGTLVPFSNKPDEAKPDKEILYILQKLTNDEKNELYLISGRKKDSLEKWFRMLNINLISEHGAWIKEKGEVWVTTELMKNDWKQEVISLFTLFMDRTPGSFIEDKDFSIAWHYRNSDSEIGFKRAMELKNILLNFVANFNLQIIEGNKVIEVRNATVNKGKIAQKLISMNKWDFILSIGDDLTDEDMFSILPDSAYSIRVGLNSTKAKFNMGSIEDVRKLLNKFITS